MIDLLNVDQRWPERSLVIQALFCSPSIRLRLSTATTTLTNTRSTPGRERTDRSTNWLREKLSGKATWASTVVTADVVARPR